MAGEALDLEPLAAATGRRMDQVVAVIRTAIDEGRMKPGVKYSVYGLSEQLGISRTPVRDALLRLEEAGLIRFEARQGFRILLPHPQEIADIFDVRLSLELSAARRAALQCDAALSHDLADAMGQMRNAASAGDVTLFARLDDELHDRILDAASNSRARRIISDLRESTRLLGASTADRSRTLSDIHGEHLPIVAAICANDANSAEDAMRNHLKSTEQLLIAQAIKDQDVDVDSVTVWSASANDGPSAC